MIEIIIACACAAAFGYELRGLVIELKRRRQNKINDRLVIDQWKDTPRL